MSASDTSGSFQNILQSELDAESGSQNSSLADGDGRSSPSSETSGRTLIFPLSFIADLWNRLRGHIQIKELTDENLRLTYELAEIRKENDEQKQLLQRERREKGKLLQEKEDVLNRLSSVAGTKLKYNNPGITDLSDNNRPNKLAERFSELYDNDWTEAFDVISSSLEGEDRERETIQRLLDLLKVVFERCRDLAAKQRRYLIALAVDPTKVLTTRETDHDCFEEDSENWSVDLKKKVSDFQKEVTEHMLENVHKLFEKDIEATERYQLGTKQGQTYLNKCVELCWYMNVQDPPLAMEFFAAEGAPYDAAVWKEYTQSGEVLQFVVWPALFLYKDGPLLNKGVLQPTHCSKETEVTQF